MGQGGFGGGPPYSIHRNICFSAEGKTNEIATRCLLFERARPFQVSALKSAEVFT